MIGFILKLLVTSLAVALSAYILPGVHVNNFLTAILVAVILGLINAFLKPLLLLLTLPINILTFGLFTFIINALLILLASSIVTGFVVDSFLWALLYSLVLSIINALLHRLLPV